MFKWSVNMSAKVERLRDFVGLENMNIMRIVAASADIVKAKLVSGKKANAGIVHAWLADNVHWGAFHCPDLGTVERHMKNWTAIQKNSRTLEINDSAAERWGRNNLLDWPTKLETIVARTDAQSMTYVVESLYKKSFVTSFGIGRM